MLLENDVSVAMGPHAAAAAESLQSCPTLCDPIDGSPPGSFAHGIFPGKSTGVGCHCLLRSKVETTVNEQKNFNSECSYLVLKILDKPPR